MFKKLALLLLITTAATSYAGQRTLNIINHAGHGYIYTPFKIAAVVAIVNKPAAEGQCKNQPPAMNACEIDAGKNSYDLKQYSSSGSSTDICLSSSSQLPSDNNNGQCAQNDCEAQVSFSNGTAVAIPENGNCGQYIFPANQVLAGDLQTIEAGR
jgi:hypothetical protein